MIKRLCLFAICLCLLSGCIADKAVIAEKIATIEKTTSSGDINSVISDIKTYKQDARYYADKVGTFPKIPSLFTDTISQSHTRKFLSPWHQGYQYGRDYLAGQINSITKDKLFGENLLPVDPKRIQNVTLNASSDTFPNLNKKGITLTNTSLRLLPMSQPLFYDPSLAGEGFPFDMIQNSSIPAGTPVFILHQSADKAWGYVTSSYAEGWIPLSEMAFVDEAFITEYENHPWVAIIRERVPLALSKGPYLFEGSIGMQFPLVSKTETSWTVWVPVTTEYQYAELKEVTIPKSSAQLKPFSLTPEHMADLANQLIGQPYGWGGLYHNRDCASMIQDLFTPFGIWLPRNGNDQGLRGGLYISVKDLSAADKEKMIIRNGIPFLTLIWFKGHIMIYVGSENGKALVLHNIWGIRTKTDEGKEGRHIIGKTVITSLEPGKELSDTDPSKLLLDRVSGFTLLVPRYE